MKYPFKTNQIKIVKFDPEVFLDRFDVYEIKTSDPYYKRGATKLFDSLLRSDECNVKSVYYDNTDGNRFYALFTKSNSNTSTIKQLRRCEGGDKISWELIKDISRLDDRKTLSLLLCALGSYSKKGYFNFCNLTGQLYCFRYGKPFTEVRGEVIEKIHSLNIRITDDLFLSFGVCTFTNTKLKDKIEFSKKRFEAYPKYVCSSSGTTITHLRRELPNDEKSADRFIIRQTTGTKAEIPFLKIDSLDGLRRSKMGVVQNVVEEFNRQFGDFCKIQFCQIEDYEVYDEKTNQSSFKKRGKELVKSLFADHRIVIDSRSIESNNETHELCSRIKEYLKNEYEIDATLEISKSYAEQFVISIVHDSQYYNENSLEDPYEAELDKQHITLENCLSKGKVNEKVLKPMVDNVLQELLIKSDVEQRRLFLYDWQASEKVVFGLKEKSGKDDEEKESASQYHFMEIFDDGTFDFKSYDEETAVQYENQSLIDALREEKTVGVIGWSNGEINIIKNTSWITIPELDRIREDIERIDKEKKENNQSRNRLSPGEGIRSKDKLDELFPAITNIKLFQHRDGYYYFVGLIDKGMNTTVQRAANIRKVESYDDSKLRFGELLPLMYVPFVRNGQLTVYPFPFKYLKEYIRADNAKRSQDEKVLPGCA